MPPPLPPEVRNAIIDDLREGRLSFEEIAAKRLGDGRKTGTISKIAKKEGLSRGVKTPSKKRAFHRDVASQKAQSILKIKLETFGPDERVNLCDTFLSQIKAMVPRITTPKGASDLSAAAERLFEQRRKDEIGGDDDDERGSIAAAFDELRRLEASPSPRDAKTPPDGV